jgi:hypothetical protein
MAKAKKDRKKNRKRKKDGAVPSRKAIARARQGVTRAGQKLADRLARLEGVADGIEAAAVERFVAAAVAELADGQLLRDLGDLRAALASAPAGNLPEEIEPFRLLPEAVLRWAQSRFGLAPYLEAGKVMQVPGDRLQGFAMTGGPGAPSGGALVRLRILAPGWKRGGEVVTPPRAEAVD